MQRHAVVIPAHRGQRRRRWRDGVGPLKEGRDGRCWKGKPSLRRKAHPHRSCQGRHRRTVRSCSCKEGTARPFVRRPVLAFRLVVSSRTGVPNWAAGSDGGDFNAGHVVAVKTDS
ncbi:hypothetical protein MRX96_015748 [Rhipicephalus microplus]